MKKIILLLLILCFVSCQEYPSVTNARQVRVGMNINELKYLMGEPKDIEISDSGERWYFRYLVNEHLDVMYVDLVENEVVSFNSY